jgi:hypothetical protein
MRRIMQIAIKGVKWKILHLYFGNPAPYIHATQSPPNAPRGGGNGGGAYLPNPLKKSPVRGF